MQKKQEKGRKYLKYILYKVRWKEFRWSFKKKKQEMRNNFSGTKI